MTSPDGTQGQGGWRCCPNCGHDFAAAKRVTDGRFSYAPETGFFADGEKLDATPQVHHALGALISANGLCVDHETLLRAMGSHGVNASSSVKVCMTHARRAFASLGIPFPVQTEWGRGLRWDAEAVPRGPVRHRATPSPTIPGDTL